MVNYDLLNMNIPMVTCGSILGVLMNNVLPECIICTILIGILMISFGKTHKRLILLLLYDLFYLANFKN